MTHAYLAGVRDMISTWFYTLLYSLFYRHNYPGLDLYSEVEYCIRECTDYAARYPEEVYDFMKMWPPWP